MIAAGIDPGSGGGALIVLDGWRVVVRHEWRRHDAATCETVAAALRQYRPEVVAVERCVHFRGASRRNLPALIESAGWCAYEASRHGAEVVRPLEREWTAAVLGVHGTSAAVAAAIRYACGDGEVWPSALVPATRWPVTMASVSEHDGDALALALYAAGWHSS